MDDLISRQAAIDALIRKMKPHDNGEGTMTIYVMSERLVKETLNDLPVAQQERCEDCENFNKTRSLIPQPERKTGRWIPCSERLPDSKDYVLVTDWGETDIGRRFDGKWVDCYGDKMKDVTAWMLLPEPYREDGEAE